MWLTLLGVACCHDCVDNSRFLCQAEQVERVFSWAPESTGSFNAVPSEGDEKTPGFEGMLDGGGLPEIGDCAVDTGDIYVGFWMFDPPSIFVEGIAGCFFDTGGSSAGLCYSYQTSMRLPVRTASGEPDALTTCDPVSAGADLTGWIQPGGAYPAPFTVAYRGVAYFRRALDATGACRPYDVDLSFVPLLDE